MLHETLILPFDLHNQKLVDNVHPDTWENPEPKPGYHLVVVGGGTAGLVAAAGAAGLGAKVALVEKHLLGGDCLNFGCVPSKALIRSARAVDDAKRAGGFGTRLEIESIDFTGAMERVRRLRAAISPHDGVWRLQKLGVDVFLGEGRFVAVDQVEVAGKRLRFRNAVVATGSRPLVPDVTGLVDAGFLTNETVFSLTQLPRRLVVVGGGPVGCELAQAFARFGSLVTILLLEDQLLPREDADAAEVVQRALEADGVKVLSRARLVEVRRRPNDKRLIVEIAGETREIGADQILVAAGRLPNVEGLGLDAAGVATSAEGVAVDDRLRTSNKKIYACGDVTPHLKFTHAADAQARIVLRNAFFFGRQRQSDLVVPRCTFTAPEVAHVGASERELTTRRVRFQKLTVPVSDVDRAVLEGREEGFLKVLYSRGGERILGATLVAEAAGDMIGELALAITHGLGMSELATTILPYPTRGELAKKVGDAYLRTRLTPFAQRLLRFYFARIAPKSSPGPAAGS